MKNSRDKIEQNSNFKFGLIILNNFVASSFGSDLKLSLEYAASSLELQTLNCVVDFKYLKYLNIFSYGEFGDMYECRNKS